MSYFSYEFTADLNESLPSLTAEEVRAAFAEHPEQLEWLAKFLTADKRLSEVCIADACALASTESDVTVQWLEPWFRACTIRSAVEMLHSRISALASIYERADDHRYSPAPLHPDTLDLLYEQPEQLARSLDVLCRAAVVLIGVERNSFSQAARILGVSRTAVELAYCAALEVLEILRFRTRSHFDINAQTYC